MSLSRCFIDARKAKLGLIEPNFGSPRLFDKPKYTKRNIIERMFGWLKDNRRIGTRYDKLFCDGFASLFVVVLMTASFVQSLDSPSAAGYSQLSAWGYGSASRNWYDCYQGMNS